MEVRQNAIINASLLLLLLDARSNFSSVPLGAGKARPAHDRGGPLLDHGLEPGLDSPWFFGFCLWLEICFRFGSSERRLRFLHSRTSQA